MSILRRWWQTGLGLALMAAAVWFLADRLTAGWEQSQAALERAAWGWLVVAVALAAGTVVLVALAWHRVLLVLGARPPAGATVAWFFLGEIGKYLPGMVWPLLGRAELARRNGVPGAVAWASVPLSLGYGVLTACLVGLVLAVAAPAAASTPAMLAVLGLAVVAGLAGLHPRLLGLPLALASRVLGRRFALERPPWGQMLAVVPWYVPGWVAVAAATWATARAFDHDVAFTTVAFPAVLAWLVGFLAVPVPGGVGVREAAFAASAAAAGLEPSVAVVVAVVSRLVFVVVDAAGFGLALGARGWRRGLQEVTEAPAAAPVSDRS